MKLHLMQFADEQAAASDPVVGGYRFPVDGVSAMWDESTTFPNETVRQNSIQLSGFWIIISSDDANTTLAQHSDCRLAWDGASGAVIGGGYTGSDMAALYVSPVPAGAVCPWTGAP